MKTRIVQILFEAMSIIVAAAVQDMSPTFGGVKVPLLLLVALQAALEEKPLAVTRREKTSPSLRWLLLAVVAGVFADALSCAPVGCGTGFAVLACGLLRVLRTFVREVSPVAIGAVTAAIAAPFHELWLSGWGVVGPEPPLLLRFFASTLPAVPLGALLFALLPRLRRAVGFEGVVVEGRLS